MCLYKFCVLPQFWVNSNVMSTGRTGDVEVVYEFERRSRRMSELVKSWMTDKAYDEYDNEYMKEEDNQVEGGGRREKGEGKMQ